MSCLILAMRQCAPSDESRIAILQTGLVFVDHQNRRTCSKSRSTSVLSVSAIASAWRKRRLSSNHAMRASPSRGLTSDTSCDGRIPP